MELAAKSPAEGWSRRDSIETEDHWTLPLFEYAPSVSAPARPPVVLISGLGVDHGMWDLWPQAPSPARELAARGYRVFTTDLRGRGLGKPKGGKAVHWTFDDFLLQDLPAILGRVKVLAGTEKLHYVGHSMGGVLGLCHQIRTGAPELLSMTAIGSSLNYLIGPTDFKFALRFLPLVKGIGLKKFGAPSGLLAPFGRLRLPWNLFLWNPANMGAEAAQRFLRECPHPVALGELTQLAGALSPEGLCSLDGKISYTHSAARATRPTLLLGAALDRQVSPESLEWTFARLGAADKKLHVVPGYGHVDLIIGERAPTDVWPVLFEWLEGHS